MIKKPLLIAEIGINHNGDLSLAKKMIDAAVDANFDTVKFQKEILNLFILKMCSILNVKVLGILKENKKKD